MALTLLTGAPGWLGTRLVQVLLEGLDGISSLPAPDGTRQIRCLVMPGLDGSTLGPAERVQVVRGDLRDGEAVQTLCRDAAGATLFHCAGVVHPARFVRELFEVNVDGTRRLLQAAEEAGVRRAVVLSSNSPAGNNPSREHRFDEQSPYHPYMAYGRSKMLDGAGRPRISVQGQAGDGYRSPDLVLRPGPAPAPDVLLADDQERRGPHLGDGGNLRSMTYIDNLCQALLLCERNPGANGQTYWVSDRRPYSMNEIVDTVERLMEKEFGLKVAHKRLRLPVGGR